MEMDLLGFKFIDQVDQSFHAAPEPIQFPYHEGVGLAQLGQRWSAPVPDWSRRKSWVESADENGG